MPPTPVYGTEAYTAGEIAEELKTAWGNLSGSFAGIPLAEPGESLKLTYDYAPPNPEFGEIGAQRGADIVGSRVEGEINFYARPDGPWFNILMAHLFGEEKRVADVWLDGTTASGGVSHFYLPNGGQRSLQFKAWKSGSLASGGYWQIFSGLMFRSCRIEFPEGGVVKFTGSFVGKSVSTATTTGTPTAPAGSVLSSARMLTNTQGTFQVGATLAAYDIGSFSINYDRAVESDTPFLNDLDTPIQPGPRSNRVVTCDIGALLYTDFYAAGKPTKEYTDRTFSKCRIILAASETAAASKPYAIMFDFPNVVWEDADNAIKTAAAIPVSYRFRAIEGASANPAHGDLDMRAATFVTPSDDSSTYFADQVVQS